MERRQGGGEVREAGSMLHGTYFHSQREQRDYQGSKQGACTILLRPNIRLANKIEFRQLVANRNLQIA
jgi:hypothetical protein